MPLLHMEFVRAGHATAPTRKNDRAYRPSSVCPSGSHLPPGEGIPQMSRYTFTLSNRTPSVTFGDTSPCTPGGSASPKASPEFERAGHAAAPTEFAGDACGIGFPTLPLH